jgi:magnesium transporter
MIRSLYLTKDGILHQDLSLMDIAFALQEPEGALWVDFESTPAEEDEPILRKTFGFHPLAIDDALQESHVPKIDDWGEYLYIVLHAVALDEQDGIQVTTKELDVFVGQNYMVTHHDQVLEVVDRVRTLIQRDPRQLKNGVDHLLYRLTDEVVASYMPVVEKLDLNIDQLEDKIFSKPDTDTLERIFAIKRAVLYLRRIVDPQREVLNKLARDDYEVIDARAQVYFRDVYDHLVRLHDIIESERDLVGGTLDTYLSMTNNRMNEIMKTLTLITTLFMPISFIASFFGMNFFQPVIPLDVWTHWRSFILTLLTIAITPIGLYVWWRRRGWT